MSRIIEKSLLKSHSQGDVSRVRDIVRAMGVLPTMNAVVFAMYCYKWKQLVCGDSAGKRKVSDRSEQVTTDICIPMFHAMVVVVDGETR